MAPIKHHIHCLILAALAVAGICVIMISCSMGAQRKRVIAVSIPPQQRLLEQIVGKRYEVVSLLGENSNPEEYESDRNIMAVIERSDAYFTIGNIGFEAAITDKARANYSQVRIFNNSDGIFNSDSCEHSPVADSGGDPHVWTSARNAKLIAANMLKAIIELDPKHERYYSKRYQTLVAGIDSLDRELSHTLDGKQGEAFAVWHPSLGYFARDYGLRQVTLNPRQPRPATPAELDGIAMRKKAKIVFCQDDFDPPHAIETMKQMNLPQIHINTMSYDWEGQMRLLAATIAKNT